MRGQLPPFLVAVFVGVFLIACTPSNAESLRQQQAEVQALLDLTKLRLEESENSRAEALTALQDAQQQLSQVPGQTEQQAQALRDSQARVEQLAQQLRDTQFNLQQTQDQLRQANSHASAAQSDLRLSRAALVRGQVWCQFSQDVYYQGLNYVSPCLFLPLPRGDSPPHLRLHVGGNASSFRL